MNNNIYLHSIELIRLLLLLCHDRWKFNYFIIRSSKYVVQLRFLAWRKEKKHFSLLLYLLERSWNNNWTSRMIQKRQFQVDLNLNSTSIWSNRQRKQICHCLLELMSMELRWATRLCCFCLRLMIINNLQWHNQEQRKTIESVGFLKKKDFFSMWNIPEIMFSLRKILVEMTKNSLETKAD